MPSNPVQFATYDYISVTFIQKLVKVSSMHLPCNDVGANISFYVFMQRATSPTNPYQSYRDR